MSLQIGFREWGIGDGNSNVATLPTDIVESLPARAAHNDADVDHAQSHPRREFSGFDAESVAS